MVARGYGQALDLRIFTRLEGFGSYECWRPGVFCTALLNSKRIQKVVHRTDGLKVLVATHHTAGDEDQRPAQECANDAAR
jgi:hypothetical protein